MISEGKCAKHHVYSTLHTQKKLTTEERPYDGQKKILNCLKISPGDGACVELGAENRSFLFRSQKIGFRLKTDIGTRPEHTMSKLRPGLSRQGALQ